jgi:CDK inhibitor PHO81
MIPSSLGVDLEIRYPTRSDAKRLRLRPTVDVNSFVDAILTVVYETTKPTDGPPHGRGRHRRIVFSSFNPVVCTALNWKQPNCE